MLVIIQTNRATGIESVISDEQETSYVDRIFYFQWE
jgi:hypothetical protein